MTFPVAPFNRVWVRGRIVDLEKMALSQAEYGVVGDVIFTPDVVPRVLISPSTKHIIDAEAFAVSPSPTDGYFQILVPCTDDPDIVPTDWTYEVREPTGRIYHIEVPINAPVLNSPGDPLHNERVLELADLVPEPTPGTGTVQLMTGRGIASMTINGSNHLIITYTDSSTQDAGVAAGVLDHGDLTGLADDDHPQYHNNARGDARYAALVHNHDSAYYTEAEVDTALAGKAAASHTHSAYLDTAIVDAKGDLLLGTADNTLARHAVGSDGRVLTAESGQSTGVTWDANPTPAPVTLTDASTVAINAAAGRVFRLTATDNRTMGIPSGAKDGRFIVIEHTASGAARTLTLPTGTAGSFIYGSDVTALTQTASGKTDEIGCVYHQASDRWRVIAYAKGF